MLRASHIFSSSSSSPIPHHQIMDTQPHQPGPSGSKSGQLADASSNMLLIGTQKERRQQLVLCEDADTASKNISEDAHLKIVHKTGNSTNTTQHAVGCEYLHTAVNSRQWTLKQIAGIRQNLYDQCITAPNGKDQWSTMEFVHTVSEIEYHDVVSSGIFTEEFAEKHPREWTKQALITLEEATKAYMIEVIAAYQCLKQQLTSFRYSTWLQLWQGKEVVYSWNSPTCTWPWTWRNLPKVGFRTL